MGTEADPFSQEKASWIGGSEGTLGFWGNSTQWGTWKRPPSALKTFIPTCKSKGTGTEESKEGLVHFVQQGELSLVFYLFALTG